ncbi:MAG: hypothetical protein DLM61_26150 [Pseudonocardiales bacterium]|nr:MAG: hypothetical protein DLM61_26150 [Pseudonocardiales bacterium]
MFVDAPTNLRAIRAVGTQGILETSEWDYDGRRRVGRRVRCTELREERRDADQVQEVSRGEHMARPRLRATCATRW